MSTTIEELARQYAEFMCPVGDYCGGIYDEQRNRDLPIYTDDAKSVLSWLFAKPLASRLTAEEKERVRANYADAKDIHLRCVETMSRNHIADLHNEYNKGLNMGIMIVLKHLFGTDFFKEEE